MRAYFDYRSPDLAAELLGLDRIPRAARKVVCAGTVLSGFGACLLR
jgi:hypothetical protein